MADIYRQELEAKGNSKLAGCILLGIGGLMLLIAVGMFFNTSRQMAKIKERPWEHENHSIIPDSSLKISSSNKANVHKVFLLWALFALLSLMMFLLIVALIHRFAQHLRSMGNKPRPKTPYSDPWKESAEKIEF